MVESFHFRSLPVSSSKRARSCLASACLLFTTVVYHGAHCAGYKDWAGRTFMKYDIAASGFNTALLIYSAGEAERPTVFVACAFILFLWLLSFPGRPLHGMPFNFLLSVMHATGVALTLLVANGRKH